MKTNVNLHLLPGKGGKVREEVILTALKLREGDTLAVKVEHITANENDQRKAGVFDTSLPQRGETSKEATERKMRFSGNFLEYVEMDEDMLDRFEACSYEKGEGPYVKGFDSTATNETGN